MTPITAHKGGRTARAPEARMTPQELSRLEVVLQRRSVKYVDWLIEHVNADYEQAAASRANGKRGGRPRKEETKMFYAAESSMGLSYTYDSPCWMLLAFDSKSKRDEYVKAHSDKAESVDYKTACKIAPALKNEAPGKAHRTILM